MNGPLVVDVGNTRIKWGRCAHEKVTESASLPPDEAEAWRAQWETWHVARDQPWIVSGVHPQRRDVLVAWLRERCDQVHVLTSFRQVPIEIEVDAPERVGIDRLLNAAAVNQRRRAGAAAVVIDAGSAVTVDYVDGAGVFRGGAIFPGLRLMAKALHDYTALLPMIAVTGAADAPGKSTEEAIRAGVYHAVLGGIERLIGEYRRSGGALDVFLTGGDAKLLTAGMLAPVQVWPEMTLEGILLSKPT